MYATGAEERGGAAARRPLRGEGEGEPLGGRTAVEATVEVMGGTVEAMGGTVEVMGGTVEVDDDVTGSLEGGRGGGEDGGTEALDREGEGEGEEEGEEEERDEMCVCVSPEEGRGGRADVNTPTKSAGSKSIVAADAREDTATAAECDLREGGGGGGFLAGKEGGAGKLAGREGGAGRPAAIIRSFSSKRRMNSSVGGSRS